MFVSDWYKSCALVACYEGEEERLRQRLRQQPASGRMAMK